MNKLQIADAEAIRLAIQREVARSENSRYHHRLHGILLLTAGLSCREVAVLLGENSTTVQRWIRRLSHGGLAALREGKRPGRPHLLDEAQWSLLEHDLSADPMNFGFADKLWNGRLLSEHLRRHYAVELGIRQCQRIFRKLRSRGRKPQRQPGRQLIF